MSRPPHPLYEQSWPEGEYRFFQLGFLVGDVLDASARWAQVFGVGPFHVLPVIDQHLIRGEERSTVTVQIAVAQAGPVQIELIQQHCDRPSIFRDMHRGNISGLHQLCTVTKEYDARKAHFEALGYELAAESVHHYRVAYFDTAADFGFYTEVVEYTPQFLTQLTQISRTCAEWDGSDPVRLLTRDGYRVP